MATHSSVLAWRIPGTGEPGGLPSMGSHRVRHDWSDLATPAALRIKTKISGHCEMCFTPFYGLIHVPQNPTNIVIIFREWKEGKEERKKVSNSATPWTIAHQAPRSMEFSRQEYWHEVPSPSPGDLPNPGIEPWSPSLQADAFTVWGEWRSSQKC